MWKALERAARAHDTTISHHHSVGILKKAYAKDEVPLDLLTRIKQAVDPGRIMSPDRLP